MSTDAMMDDVSPIDPDDELLVAYLDGELNTRERDALEDRLLEDAALRGKLQSLQAGWEMLDVLPAPTTNERLVESTLEMVVSDILKIIPGSDDETSENPAVALPLTTRYRWPVIVAGVSLLAAAIGWFAGYQFRGSAEREQLAKLALAENLDAYLWSGDLKLMRTLQNDPAWLNMLTTANEIGTLQADTSTVVRDTAIGERFELIQQMSVPRRAALETRWDEFSQLDPPMLVKVRETAAAVGAQPDADLLLQTMSQYAAWRATLPGEMRDAIEKSVGSKQKLAVAEAIDFTLELASRRSGGMLDEDTVERIYFAFNKFLEERIERDPGLKESLDRASEVFGAGASAFAIARMVSDDGRGRGRPSSPPGFAKIPPITATELDSIIGILSDSAIDNLNLLTNWSPYSGHDPRLLESTLRAWAEETVRRKFESFRPDRGSLMERYTELTSEQRDELDLQRPSEIKRRLTGRGRSSFGR